MYTVVGCCRVGEQQYPRIRRFPIEPRVQPKRKKRRMGRHLGGTFIHFFSQPLLGKTIPID